MRKKIVFAIGLIYMVSILTGCAVGPIMSEEQGEEIANYSTALLLKYDANYTTRLVDTAAIEAERAIAEEEEQARIEAEQAAMETEVQEEQDEQEVVIEDVILDIDDTLGIDSVNIEYSYFEITDQYPSDDVEVFAPVMKSEDGNKLFVVHFTATNSTDVAINLNINDLNAMFRLETNTISKRNTFATLLLNDFAYYTGTLESGEMQDLVLITEMSETEAVGIETIYLTIKVNGEVYRTKLQ